MGQMVGADADGLDGLAAELSRTAERIERTRRSLGSQVNGAPWHGASGDAFRHRWHGEYQAVLVGATGVLASGADVLRRNADQQREASGGGSGGSWTIALPGGPGGLGSIDPSLWEKFLSGDFGLELQTLLWIIESGASAAELLKLIKLPSWLGILSGLVQTGLGIADLLDHDYTGGFDLLESFGDILSIRAGVLSTAAGILSSTPLVAHPIGFAIYVGLLGQSVLDGGTSLAIDRGLEFWDKEGGREWWYRSAAPVLDRAWDGATGAVDRTWDRAYEAGSNGYQAVTGAVNEVWDAGFEAVNDVADSVGDVGSDVVSGAKQWIPGL